MQKQYSVRAVACDHRAGDEEVYGKLKDATSDLPRSWERLQKARTIAIKLNQDFPQANVFEGQRRKYLALYELETDNPHEFDLKVQERGKWTKEMGRLSDLPEFEPPEFPRIYRQIMPEKKV